MTTTEQFYWRWDVAAVNAAHDVLLANRIDNFGMAQEIVRRVSEAVTAKRITHGRHCTCGACAREDWTNPQLAPCGMHGSDCPALYQPWGPAGDPIPKRPRPRSAR